MSPYFFLYLCSDFCGDNLLLIYKQLERELGENPKQYPLL